MSVCDGDFFCGTAVPYRSISENRVSTSEIREMGRRGRAVKVFPSMREFRKRKGLPLFFFLLSALPLSCCARHAFSRTLWAGTARENSGKWISRNIPRRRAGPLQMKDTLFLLLSSRNASYILLGYFFRCTLWSLVARKMSQYNKTLYRDIFSSN